MFLDSFYEAHISAMRIERELHFQAAQRRARLGVPEVWGPRWLPRLVAALRGLTRPSATLSILRTERGTAGRSDGLGAGADGAAAQIVHGGVAGADTAGTSNVREPAATAEGAGRADAHASRSARCRVRPVIRAQGEARPRRVAAREADPRSEEQAGTRAK